MFQVRATWSETLLVAASVLVWAATLGGCSGAAATDDPAAGPVAPAEARRLVEQGATLLDVRTPAEWDDGHVEGAVLIPLQELGARLAEVPRDRPVVVYCHSGGRSARAASMLRAAGHDVHDLGAMSRWPR